VRGTKRANIAEEIATLLAGLPKVDPCVIPFAVEVLMGAADDYKASKPVVDPKGRRSKPKLAEARASVVAVHKHLSRANEQLSTLPVDAIAAIGHATDAPFGKVRRDLDVIRQSIEELRRPIQQAMSDLAARPNRVTDAERNVLAYRVAVVFRDILNLKPTSTSEKQLTQNATTSRGGAAYARVLRVTLKAAGIANCDMGPLITAGLGLLKDPDIPSSD